jgi:hypothetical protein
MKIRIAPKTIQLNKRTVSEMIRRELRAILMEQDESILPSDHEDPSGGMEVIDQIFSEVHRSCAAPGSPEACDEALGELKAAIKHYMGGGERPFIGGDPDGGILNLSPEEQGELDPEKDSNWSFDETPPYSGEQQFDLDDEPED